MNTLWFLSLLTLLLGLAAQGQSFVATSTHGCEFLKTQVQDVETSVPAMLLKCDPKVTEVKLLATSAVLGGENAYAAFSLREVWAKTGASIVVNAGSTASFSTPMPAGLLKVRGKILNRVKDVPSEQHPGVLCLEKNRVRIIRLPGDGETITGCIDAVQRGPVLTTDLVPQKDGSSRFRRTVAAVDGEGNFLLLVTADGARLSAVAGFLYKPEFHVLSALNLDGGASSGLLFSIGGGQTSLIGNVDGLVASVIAIGK